MFDWNNILSCVHTLGFRQSVFASSPLHEDSAGVQLPTDTPTQNRHVGVTSLDTDLDHHGPKFGMGALGCLL